MPLFRAHLKNHGAVYVSAADLADVTEVLRAALSAGRYPISAFPAGLRTLFTVVLPVAFLTTVPAEAILGRASSHWLLLSVAVAVAALLFSRWFWRLALRDYTSASS